MTIPNTARKAGPLLGTGSQTAWPFTFKVFAAGDVQVTIANSAGTETLLTLGTDYTVTLNSNQDTSPGGTVNYPISGAALPVGSVLAIIGDLDYDQPLDLPSGGNFSPLALENQLDRATMQIQQLKEEVDRSAKLPPTSAESVEALVDDLQRLADSADNLDTVADNIADITAVANDLNEPVSEINTVAGAIANVNAVGSNITNVNTVAGISANVTTVAGVAANVTAVAAIDDDVTAVAGVAAAVTAVAAIDDDVSIAAANVADITNFADVYQGAKASDPALRNDGNALQAGDLYFNTTNDEMRVYGGTLWKSGFVGTVAVQNFSGNGSTTAFTLTTAPGGENNTQIFIGGVYQQKDQYSVSGTTLTFSTAPTTGTNNIEVVTISTLALGETDASLVSFVQAGAGAVERTVQGRLRETVSVKDFGAVGDGVTNDTASIQLAVTYGLANNAAVYWPNGIYLCGALTAPSGGDLVWFGDGSAEIKRTGTDITLISPTGNTGCRGLKFTDYMIGFDFTGIAAAKTVVFSDCTIQNCGTTATASGRVDYQGFITNKNASSNKIARLQVVDCGFTGDDFGIVWQGKLDSASVTGCSFSTMRRMGVLIGLQASGRTSKDCENIVITGNTFQDIVSNDANEVEIHAVLVYGYRVVVSNNTVDKCADIHASTHDSEAIYLKAVLATVEGNIVQDGGRGDGTITIKGDAFTGEPEDVPDANRAKYVIVSGNVVTASDDFVSTYSKPFSGIYAEGSRVDIKNNSISGKFIRGIQSFASGHIAGNTISADVDYGILYSPIDATDQTFIKITDNVVELLGATSAGISTRLAATTAMALPVAQIDNNVVRLGSAATTTGEETGISVRADRVASGNNTYNFVQINNNNVNGRSGINFRAIGLVTNNGTGNNGLITTAHLIGNSARFPLYGVSISGSAGDIGYMHAADSTFNGTVVSAFNNPNLPTTTKIRNIRGNRVTTNAGTATITAANTEVTVTMGINDSNMQPTSLSLISVRPTNNIGTATKWWIDTLSGDTFKIKVDAAPGATTATFAWEAKNQYYY